MKDFDNEMKVMFLVLLVVTLSVCVVLANWLVSNAPMIAVTLTAYALASLLGSAIKLYFEKDGSNA